MPASDPTVLEGLRSMPTPPVARLVGFEMTAVDPGRAVMELAADGRHANPMGTLHGGILCDIADAAMGIAFRSLLEPGQSFTTIELKINYLKPVWEARLRAEGRVVKKGRTVGLVVCDVTDQEGVLVAYATSTCMVLDGDRAAGR